MAPEGPAVILVEATPEMSRARDRATHAAWGGPLSMEAYAALEWRLRGHPWSRDAVALWLLCADGGDVLSSCETYRMTSLRCAGLAAGHSYGVASVYTEPQLRRRGYVGELLGRLADHLTGTDPDAQAMILYSDVALGVYQRCGFVARPALEWVFASLPGDPRDGVDELLGEDRLAPVLAGVPRPVTPFLIWPTAAQIDWHLERERIFAKVMARTRPPAWGARLGGAAAFWCAEYRSGALMVLLLYAPGRGEAQALLTSARRAAHAAGLARTLVWKLPGDGPWSQAGIEDRSERLESVPMIRPLAPGVRAADWNWIPRALWV
jgi:hypothetical protein